MKLIINETYRSVDFKDISEFDYFLWYLGGEYTLWMKLNRHVLGINARCIYSATKVIATSISEYQKVIPVEIDLVKVSRL